MNQFTKRGFAVTVGHVVVLTIMLASTELSRLFMRDNDIRPIDFTIAIPDLGQSKLNEQQAPKKDPTPVPPAKNVEPTPPPKPVLDEAKKDPTPTVTVVPEKPTWKPVSPSDIKIGPPIKPSKKKVNLPPPTVKDSPLTQAQIEKALLDGATISDRNSIPEGDVRFKAMIQNACYRAWEQPVSSIAAGKSVDAELRFNLQGQVISYQILRRSGVPELDRSVEAALAAIGSVHGIPAEFFEYHGCRITVVYKGED